MAHTKNWIRRDKRLAIYLRDGFECVYCGAKAESPGVMLSLDHLICRSAGGGNNASNLITACMHCNSTRRDTELGEWLQIACGDDAAKTARFIADEKNKMTACLWLVTAGDIWEYLLRNY